MQRCAEKGNLKSSWRKMETSKFHMSNNQFKHRSLNPFRVLRGFLCLVVLLSTAFYFLVCFAPIAVVIMRIFSKHYSRKMTSFLYGLWLALWPFLFEKINKTKFIFSGGAVPAMERVLLVSNHRTEVDWMYLWNLALRKGCLGYIKYILKSSLMKLPLFGWGFHVLEFIPVERKWEVDEPIMREMLSSFSNADEPLWLAVFPEGTDFTEKKCRSSQKFAAENGLPVLSNVLMPKTKGFYACLEVLRSSLDAVYDVTIAYKHGCPTFLDNLFGVDPSEVHIHVRRIPMEEIPVSESDVGTWLIETFRMKDELLSDFRAQGHFPHERVERELSTLKCVVKFSVVIVLTALFIYLTFFSLIWFKLYMGASCVYLASATYLNIRPSPVIDLLKQRCIARKKDA